MSFVVAVSRVSEKCSGAQHQNSRVGLRRIRNVQTRKPSMAPQSLARYSRHELGQPGSGSFLFKHSQKFLR